MLVRRAGSKSRHECDGRSGNVSAFIYLLHNATQKNYGAGFVEAYLCAGVEWEPLTSFPAVVSLLNRVTSLNPGTRKRRVEEAPPTEQVPRDSCECELSPMPLAETVESTSFLSSDA